MVSGKHIGVSQLIEADSQHLYEKTVDDCSVYRFNSYEHRCKRVLETSRPRSLCIARSLRLSPMAPLRIAVTASVCI